MDLFQPLPPHGVGIHARACKAVCPVFVSFEVGFSFRQTLISGSKICKFFLFKFNEDGTTLVPAWFLSELYNKNMD